MRRAGHGGQCCGRFHIMDFVTGPTLAMIAIFNSRLGMGYSRMCCEVVLTDNQLHNLINTAPKARYRTWAEALPDFGFTQVARFRNPNSGNYCNVFLNKGTTEFIKRKRKRKGE